MARIFFGVLWLIACQLWGKVGLWFISFFICAGIGSAANEVTNPFLQFILGLLATSLSIAIWLIPGFLGNFWQTQNLERRGFEYLSTEEGDIKDTAIRKAKHNKGLSKSINYTPSAPDALKRAG